MTYCQSKEFDFPMWVHVATMMTMQDDNSKTMNELAVSPYNLMVTTVHQR